MSASQSLNSQRLEFLNWIEIADKNIEVEISKRGQSVIISYQYCSCFVTFLQKWAPNDIKGDTLIIGHSKMNTANL